ncbi:xylulokinase [Clostridia bacterium]|nr:xylulokinase [Clostridia bacterium]
MDLLMGVDLGSTTVKAVIYKPTGEPVAEASVKLPLTRGDKEHPTWCYWMPDDVWGSVKTVVKKAVGDLPSGNRVKALAVTGFGMDGLPINKAGKELYPFISWHCPRTLEQLEWARTRIRDEDMFDETLKRPMPIDTIYRILWIKKHKPEIYENTYKWLLIEDYVNFKFSGEIASDFSMSSTVSAMRQDTHSWSEKILSLFDIPRDILPIPRQSNTVLGKVLPSVCAETELDSETLVILGGHDYICSAFASGILSGEDILDINGTWEMLVGGVDDISNVKYSEELFYIESHVVTGRYCAIEAAISGDMVEWVKSLANLSWDEFVALAAGSPIGARGCTLLPHFTGADAPRQEPTSLGAFVGLSNNVGYADLARAVIEGLTYKTKEMLVSLSKAVDTKYTSIKATGGAIRNKLWMQTKADILGIPVEIPDLHEATPLGAALLAGVGTGVYKDEKEAIDTVLKIERVYEPDPKRHEIYTDLYENVYRKMQGSLSDVNLNIYNRFIK